MGGGEATAKTANYVLTAADAGTTVIMNAAGATTITVNTALFAAGDTVNIQNIGAGICTVTAGTATVNTAGSLALNQYEGGVLYFRSTSASTFFDYVQTGSVSPLTTKGDLYGFSTLDARIPVGTNNQVLTADSAQALGLKWATPTSGSYTLLSTTSFSGSSTVISSISQSYRHLYMTIEDFVPASGGGNFVVYPGGQSPYGYRLETLGTSPTNNNQTFAGSFSSNSGMPTSAALLGSSLLIENYTTTNPSKFGMMKSAYKRDTAPTLVMAFDVGAMASSAAISQMNIQLGATATATMTIKMYGIN
jgi:hypothetical protein